MTTTRKTIFKGQTYITKDLVLSSNEYNRFHKDDRMTNYELREALKNLYK